jgi:heat shock protein HslJ
MLNVTWNLTAIERIPQQDVENTTGSGITVMFDANGVASGSGGCNNYSFGYSAGPNNALSFGLGTTTTKFCGPEAVMDLEQEYFQALGSVTTYTLNGSNLSLTYNNGQSRLDFVGATGGGSEMPTGMPTTGDGDAFGLPGLLTLLAALGILGGLLIRRQAKLAEVKIDK